MAKRAGYRSRAAFKLSQLNRRFGLLRRGDVVIDLGAAPGGWLQVAREAVGSRGFVLGVDLQPIERLPWTNVKAIVADLTNPLTPELILQNLPRQADVVLSDASPKLSGIRSIDHERSVELAKAALEIAGVGLKEGGDLLVKVFQGDRFAGFLGELERKFKLVKITRPLASRKGSSEVYVVAKGFKL